MKSVNPTPLAKSLSVLAGVALVALLTAVPVRSQESTAQADLKAKVAELVQALDAPKATERQKAQAALIEMGPAALPLLPAADSEEVSAEQRRRLAEVRVALNALSGKASLAASKITLSAQGVTLSDALAAIQKQSGNEIVDLREEFGQPVTNPEFPVDWTEKPFWEVMDELSSKANVSCYLQLAERQIGILMQSTGRGPVAYAGPLRMALTRIVRQRTYEDGKTECILEIEIAWEPRVRPILFELRPADLEVVDDLDRRIEVEAEERPAGAEGQDMSIKAAPDAQVVRTDFYVRLAKPQKGADRIKRISGKLGVLLPANIQTFDFPELATAKNAKKQSGSVTVTLEKFHEIDDGLWQADVQLDFDANSEAFESYETWFLENEVYLERADGTRFPVNGGNTVSEIGQGRVGIEYRFVDTPGRIRDYKLVYKTPSMIVRDAVEFEFSDIELP